MRFFLKRSIETMGLLLIPLVAPMTPASAAEMWISSNTTASDYYDFFRSPESLDKTFSRVKVYKLYIDALNQPGSVFSYDGEELSTLGRFLQSKNIRVAIEAGGPLGHSLCNAVGGVGFASANVEFEKLKSFYAQTGYLPQILVLDGPISRVLAGARAANCKLNVLQAVAQLTSYLVQMKKRYAEYTSVPVEFHLLVNFPNWSYKKIPGSNQSWAFSTDYASVLKAAVVSAKEAGAPLRGLQIDCPYNYLVRAGGKEKKRLPMLADQAKSLGLKVGVIFNTERSAHWSMSNPRPNNVSLAHDAAPKAYSSANRKADNNYKSDVMAYSRFWRDNIGTPNISVVQSWHNAPFYFGPEANPVSLSAIFLAVAGMQSKPKISASGCTGSCRSKISPLTPTLPAGLQACSAAKYLALRPDVAASPYYAKRVAEHYINFGVKEGMCDPR